MNHAIVPSVRQSHFSSISGDILLHVNLELEKKKKENDSFLIATWKECLVQVDTKF